MSEYEDKLNSFAQRLKTESIAAPMQEVRPIEKVASKPKKEEKIVRTTIHLSASLHHKVKMHCVKNKISFKEYVTGVIGSDIKTH